MYNIQNRQIFSAKNGKLVATLDENNVPVFEPGMAPAHKTKLDTWMAENGVSFSSGHNEPSLQETEQLKPQETAPETEQGKPQETAQATQAVPPENSTAPSRSILSIEDIPEHRLPPFDRRLGMSTPRLREFIAFHQLDTNQVRALVRRLERRRRRQGAVTE